ncbi:Two component system response regulator, sigma54-specific [Desulfonema limicola]|uniref:Two component system response regulator, sigma54-specific n=1 Tax=Desulfonema limicola TaxID=45656 RepID=A0A975B8G2_9BACT|nr:sigma-54 dependent transcriptional regulator [Desulfonema limicola]QTA80597.1 Two component system response regulator, sigma54-specific [Desulfonema limicola]
MKYFFTPSYARTLEKLEIIRSSLRWKSELDYTGIQNILAQINQVREEIILLAAKERFRQGINDNIDDNKDFGSNKRSSRKQALLDRNFIFDGVFGDNENLLEMLEIAEKAARTYLPVLIEGESGTGKELLAKVIHANSPRAGESFVSVNCGAITPTLLESELFGHVKGSFTGSLKDRKGKFETAHKGTIFLDEIGELPKESQVKLLRVLENGDIQRVGSDETIYVDTRIIAATNRYLFQMVKNKKFREDLYYRLSVISLTLPPLRERKDEIPLLIDYFCTEAAEKLDKSRITLSPRLRHFLMNHSFRGNIRELRNIIYRITCLADDTADLRHLPEVIRPELSDSNAHDNLKTKNISLDEARKSASDEAEKKYLEDSLKQVKGNVTTLAKYLNMNRSYLQTLLKKRGIKPRDFKSV